MKSAFTNGAITPWSPSHGEIRRLAVFCWFQLLLCAKGTRSSYELQKRLHPSSIRKDAGGQTIRSNSWRRYEVELRFPGVELVTYIDERVPGSAGWLYSPVWQVLASNDPAEAWQVHVLPLLKPELRGRWIRLSSEGGKPLEWPTWLYQANRYPLLDSIALMLGALFVAIRKRDNPLGWQSITHLIHRIFAEKTIFSDSDHPAVIYDAISRHVLCRYLQPAKFTTYDFRAAHRAIKPLRLLNSMVSRPLAQSDVLYPGNAWCEVSAQTEPGVQEFKIETRGDRLLLSRVPGLRDERNPFANMPILHHTGDAMIFFAGRIPGDEVVIGSGKRRAEPRKSSEP